jgi:hypothetical protein
MATQYTAGIVPGQKWTAAIANQIGAAWESYTPTVSQPGAITFTTSYSKYCQVQKTVVVENFLSITGTGTGGNAIRVSLPIAATLSGACYGSAFFYDASANNCYNLTVLHGAATDVVFFYNLVGASSNFGSAPNIPLGNGDQIRFSIVYEAA